MRQALLFIVVWLAVPVTVHGGGPLVASTDGAPVG
jgi:hypothetical protein